MISSQSRDSSRQTAAGNWVIFVPLTVVVVRKLVGVLPDGLAPAYYWSTTELPVKPAQIPNSQLPTATVA
jgi:hypothetical protein